MMRSGSGRLAGYIQKMGDTVRCKLTEGAGEALAEVTLLLADGRSERREAPLDGSEVSWAAPAGGLTGAYTIAGGRVLCASDERAHAAGLRRLDEKRPRRAVAEPEEPENAPETPKEAPVDEEKAGPAVSAAALGFPERRWPPPPCCPRARYVGGMWVTQDEGTSDATPSHGAT